MKGKLKKRQIELRPHHVLGYLGHIEPENLHFQIEDGFTNSGSIDMPNQQTPDFSQGWHSGMLMLKSQRQTILQNSGV